MDPRQENELLMHIAAETDPMTTLAALPREGELAVGLEAKSSNSWIAFAV
jgi:hypothetical protein